MVNPKSLENLEKGRRRKHKPKLSGKSWKQLIIEVGQEAPPNDLLTHGKTWKEVVVRRAYVLASLGNAAILKELMQRSEPQSDYNVNINWTELTDAQLERLADGEDIESVLRSQGKG